MPRVRTAPRSESVGTCSPKSAEFASRKHCAASDSSRPIKSATRCRSTFSGGCDSSASRLCRIAGTPGIESNRSARFSSTFWSAAFAEAGSLKRAAEIPYSAIVRKARLHTIASCAPIHFAVGKAGANTKLKMRLPECDPNREEVASRTARKLHSHFGPTHCAMRPRHIAILCGVFRQLRQALAMTLGRSDYFHLAPVIRKFFAAI